MTHEPVRNKVNQWLAELGAAAGEHFVLDEEQRIGLNYEGLDCFLELDMDQGLLHLALPLVKVPEEHQADFLRKVLAMNLFRQETGGATLALDPAADMVVFCHHLEVEITDLVLFQNVFGNFLEIARTLSSRLARELDQAIPTPTQDTLELAQFQV